MFTGIIVRSEKQKARAQQIVDFTTWLHFHFEYYGGHTILQGIETNEATDHILRWVQTGKGINPFKPDKALKKLTIYPTYLVRLNSQVEGEARYQLLRMDPDTGKHTQLYTHDSYKFLDFVARSLRNQALDKFNIGAGV